MMRTFSHVAPLGVGKDVIGTAGFAFLFFPTASSSCARSHDKHVPSQDIKVEKGKTIGTSPAQIATGGRTPRTRITGWGEACSRAALPTTSAPSVQASPRQR